MAKFRCNLANTKIKAITFSDHCYETDNEKEIDFLREYGSQQGVTITEISSEIQPKHQDKTEDIGQDTEKRKPGRPKGK